MAVEALVEAVALVSVRNIAALALVRLIFLSLEGGALPLCNCAPLPTASEGAAVAASADSVLHRLRRWRLNSREARQIRKVHDSTRLDGRWEMGDGVGGGMGNGMGDGVGGGMG